MADAKVVTKAELKSFDFVSRGNKSSSPLNTSLYLGLRTLDLVLQLFVLSGYGSYLITLVGGSALASSSELRASTGLPLNRDLGLSTYRLIIVSMNLATVLKHYWFVLRVSEEAWTLAAAIVVGLDNIAFDTVNTFLFLWSRTSAAAQPAGEHLDNPYLWAGLVLFVTGLAIECACEIDRRRFKSDPRNKGKPYTQGWFAVVRHPNYTAFTMWRAGLAVTASGMTLGVVIASFFAWDFSNRAVPALDEYCSKRYGEMWAEYKKRTPFTLVPSAF